LALFRTDLILSIDLASFGISKISTLPIVREVGSDIFKGKQYIIILHGWDWRQTQKYQEEK
jgi:hypothetical protein